MFYGKLHEGCIAYSELGNQHSAELLDWLKSFCPRDFVAFNPRIGETNNIAKTHIEIVQQLTRQLHDWQEGVMNSLMEADYKQKGV